MKLITDEALFITTTEKEKGWYIAYMSRHQGKIIKK
jgi:hypothetical protein